MNRKGLWRGLGISFLGAGAGLFLYCGSFYVESYLENRQTEAQYEELRRICRKESPKEEKKDKRGLQKTKRKQKNEEIQESFGISWEELRAVNRDILGWITIPGADISYPVVQGEEDLFYLTHSVEGEKSPFGSIFLGWEHGRDFRDSHSLVYGHNMEGNLMFANLNRYESSDFFGQCPEFVITTPKRRLVYEIFSVEQAREGSEAFRYGYEIGSREYQRQLEVLKARSLYETGVFPNAQQNMVTLVTCNSRLEADVRMTVHGILRSCEQSEQ